METRVLLNILIFMSTLFYVHCCGRQKKPTINCPNPGRLTQCAMLYTDYSCNGRAIGIEFQDYHEVQDYHKINYVHSAVVKRDCLLKIKNDWQTMLYITGINGELAESVEWNGDKEIIGDVGNRNKRDVGNRHKRQSDTLTGRDRSYWPKINSLDIDTLMCSCNDNDGCPNHRYLKPMTRTRKQMCALMYPHATDDPNTSCFGSPVEVYNGERATRFEKLLFDDEMSAIVVRDGCTVTGYEHRDFDGTWKNFTGVTSKLGYMNNRISSYICKCEFPALDCIPSESWKKITICSNPDQAEMTCQYWVSYGFTTGSTSTTEHGVTQNIEVSFGVQLKEIFNLGITSNTGYSWKTSTAFSKSESEDTKYVVHFKVPKGETYALYQLWGHCGQSDVKTKYFEVRNERTAEVIEHKGDS